MDNGRFWMWFWGGVVVFVAAQTAVFAVFGWLATNAAISTMSIEAMFLGAGAGFQSTLSMRKADPKDPL